MTDTTQKPAKTAPATVVPPLVDHHIPPKQTVFPKQSKMVTPTQSQTLQRPGSPLPPPADIPVQSNKSLPSQDRTSQSTSVIYTDESGSEYTGILSGNTLVLDPGRRYHSGETLPGVVQGEIGEKLKWRPA